ncbi:Calpain large subunit domain [Trypanosoma vivax]|uniref:Putative calpain n=1 Tax=Trypanosoma vivax (strain Y486) TaxID=1055687 RepID=G0U5I2_TRYVY|nr:putative calpain [Trypanosoma vivax]KAH8614536.1 Calpain large subunit domain [Trypanosoma vivax]CCC51133.1 putative calpain [Trypanosoma vivax Y486]
MGRKGKVEAATMATTLDDLYQYYCRRKGCKANSSFSKYLCEEFERHGGRRVLETVDLSMNYIGKKGVIPILDLVKNVKTVKKLDLSNNMLEHEQLEHLVYCLALHPSIEEVVLNNNNIYDSSLNLIMKLLEANEGITSFSIDGNEIGDSSLVALREQLEVNKLRKAQREEDISVPSVRRFYRAQVTGELGADNSGGHIHYATWWKNPQYVMRASKRAQVRIVMDIEEVKIARQASFFVFCSDGTRKVIEISDGVLVAESNCHDSHCYVTMTVAEDEVYNIMPCTFYPQRDLKFSITAELCYSVSDSPGGWITLEPVDPQLDWVVNVVEAEWTSESAGGSPLYHTWFRNEMVRVQYAGSIITHRMASSAAVTVKLTKSNDADDNDEKRIGFHVITPDAEGSTLSPIYCKDDCLRHYCSHQHKTTVSASLLLPCTALDFFIVPSTQNPNEFGTYTLVVFSTVPLTVTSSTFPHNWNYRVVEGMWDEFSCGGSRELSMSWKCNPSVALSFDPDQVSPGFTVFLEAASLTTRQDAEEDARDGAVEPSPTSPDSKEDYERNNELVEFLNQHRAKRMDAHVTIVRANPPHYSEIYASDYISDVFTRLTVPGISDPFFLVVTTRFAGQLGKFKLHIFSVNPFVVDALQALSLRERHACLLQYAQETKACEAIMRSARGMRPQFEESEEIIIERNEIIRKCMTTGEKYIDRDFPRGGSSLFLDPALKPPPDFPKEVRWKRPPEISNQVTFLANLKSDTPFPYSKREWFASVAHAIAIKPKWLQNIAVGYHMQEGMAQFRFFKNGKWEMVTVDDYLPVDGMGELCMGHAASDHADFFFPLMEKAYAKMHRCYETLELKVTPGVDVAELLCQGLMDLSGCVTVNVPLTGSVRMPQQEQDVIWTELKNAIQPDILCSLLLRSDSGGATERCNRGILMDHLYPVLDARFVEGQRLVKLRHWGQQEEIHWWGKWRTSSDKWTEAMREILEFNEDDCETLWMSYDEVLFYFTNLLINTVTSNKDWVLSGFTDSTKMFSVSPLDGVQFSLKLGEFPPGVKKLAVLLGLHQLDPRTTILRDKDAQATFRTSIGMTVVQSGDNTVWMGALEGSDAVKCVEPSKRRDTLCPLIVEPENALGNRLLTVIVKKEDPKAPNVQFLLSAWSESCRIEIVPVERNAATVVEGEWPTDYPIGKPLSTFWRDCPQYFLYPSETTDISISLSQKVGVDDMPKQIGFTVHNARACRSYLDYDPGTVLLSVQPDAATRVEGTVRLLGMKERKGMPYIVVPFCNNARPGGKYALEAISNRSMRLCRINPQLDWHRERRQVSFLTADGSVGGSPRFSSWRSSPQFALTFPLGAHGRLYVSLTNDCANDTRTEIGMTLLKGDMEWDDGKRRKLVISHGDIIARTEEATGAVTLDCVVNVEPEQTLILLVYASMPYRVADVTVSLYSCAAVEMEPVREWPHVSTTEGSWELGYTAGGGSEEYGSWVNNPFVALNTFRKTQIVALLLQYPRGPDKPIVKRCGDKKAFLPPIIANPNNRMEIAIDLNYQDGSLTPIATTPYTRNSEVALVVTVPAADVHPYIFVPHTKHPEGNGDYKLFVYSDHRVELYTVAKERIAYV